MNGHLFEKELFIRFTVRVFRERLCICMCFSFPFGFEDGMCDFIPDGCLSIYLSDLNTNLIYNETCFSLSY